MLRTASAVLFLASVAVFAYWGYAGAHFATRYEVPTSVKEVDEFGDEVTRTEMVKTFEFGLTPSDYYVDGALPFGGILAAMGVGAFVGHRRRRTA